MRTVAPPRGNGVYTVRHAVVDRADMGCANRALTK